MEGFNMGVVAPLETLKRRRTGSADRELTNASAVGRRGPEK
mgnify:CR=1 FL=1